MSNQISMCSMLQRFMKCCEYIFNIDISSIDELMLSAGYKEWVINLGDRLIELNDAAFRLQSDHRTIRHTSVYFGSALIVWPTLEAYDQFNTCIVCSPSFKLVVLKVQHKRTDDLTTAERFVLRELLLRRIELIRHELCCVMHILYRYSTVKCFMTVKKSFNRLLSNNIRYSSVKYHI